MKKILVAALLIILQLVLILSSCSVSNTNNKKEENTMIWKQEAVKLASSDLIGPSGVPLGGIGTGYYEISPEGCITRTCINNIHENYIEKPIGMFLAVWERNGKKTNAYRLQKDLNNDYGMKGFKSTSYIGLFPIANLDFNDFNGNQSISTKVSYKAYSGVVAHDVKDSSLPVSWYEVTIENTTDNTIETSVALSWADIIGRGIKDTDRYNENGFNLDGNSDYWHFMTPPETSAENINFGLWKGIKQYAKDSSKLNPEKWTLQNYNSEFSILAKGDNDTDISLLYKYDLKNISSWDSFINNGEFDDKSEFKYLSNGGNPQNPESGSAVAVKTTLRPREKKVIKFMVSWFMEEPDQNIINSMPAGSRHKDMNYGKYYHNFFKTSKELNEYAIKNQDNIYKGTIEWQIPILKSHMPDFLKFKQINSGYTLFTNCVLNTDMDFSSLEGAMGGLGGTMDQKMSSHPFYQKLFTQLDTNENQQFANYPNSDGEIAHFDMHYYDGVNSHIEKRPDHVNVLNSMVDNTGSWLIQIMKTYDQTGNIELIKKNYPVIKSAMKFMQNKCPRDINIPQWLTTYDDYHQPDGFIYSGILYITMLDLANRAALLMRDNEQAIEYQELKEKTYNDVQKLYVGDKNNGYYALGLNNDSREVQKDIIHSAALAGQFISRYSGWGDVVPFNRAQNTLEKYMTTAVQASPDYFAGKIYNLKTEQFLDPSGSSCWSFYQDSYVAMNAIQLGYVEDGLTLLEYTQKVHKDLGYTWSQNLWTPGYTTYMTSPVVWFVNDVLAGAAIDVNNNTMTLGPSAIPGTGKLKVPLYYPDFWAELTYNEDAQEASLKITKVFDNKHNKIEKLIGSPNGIATDELKEIKLDKPFVIKEGAVLDLTPYFNIINGSESYNKILKPVPEYDKGKQPEKLATGTGLKAEYFNDTNFLEAVDTEIVNNIDFNWGSDKPSDNITSNKYAIRWSGLILPRYAQEYTLTMKVNGGVRLWIDNTLVIDKWENIGSVSVKGSYTFNTVKLYPIKVEYRTEEEGKAVFEWWSTSQTQSVVIKERLYPPLKAYEWINNADYSVKSDTIMNETDHMAYIANGTYLQYSNVYFDETKSKIKIKIEAATPMEGGEIQIRKGSPNGELLATININNTGGWANWKTFSSELPSMEGYQDICFKFKGKSGFLFNVRKFIFIDE